MTEDDTRTPEEGRPARFSNPEVVTIALYLASGASHPVDTEDIAMKTAEVAPGRFSWRKYKDQVNMEAVRKRLTDATREDMGGYVSGSQKFGWQLTEAGMVFAETALTDMNQASLARQPMSKTERNWANRERARMLTSKAYEVYREHGIASVTIRQAEEFFRIDDYIEGIVRDQRIDRILNVFGSDEELSTATKELATLVRGDMS